MSFAPLLSQGSPYYAFVRSSISEYLSSLAALCSSILAATLASIDSLATQIPPSWCPRCRFKQLWESYSNTRTQTAAPVSSHSTENYVLKKLEDIDSESTTTALVLDSKTNICTLKKLEDIDGEFYRATRSETRPRSLSLSPTDCPTAVEKAIFRDILPSSPQSVKLQLPGESKLLSEILGDDTTTRKNRRLKHQPSLVEGIFIIPGKWAGIRTTISTNDAHEDQLPAELSATLPSVKRKRQEQQPVELPADEISPVAVIPQAVLPTPPSQPPLLPTPRPRSPKSRKASPLLAPPPPTRTIADLERKISCASSVGSGSIQIAYTPSH